MTGHNRLLAFAWIAVAGVLVPGSSAWSAPERAPAELLEDAALHDVFFLDPDRGWAVGDHGAIWCTEDGGRQWRPQESPLGCPLHAVWFLDDENGWAVGGWTHPYTHKSTGIVLRTTDGGQTWRQLPTVAVPTLRRIRMFDAKNGWAVGAASTLFPSGAYRTEDGGRGWAPIGGERAGGWQCGDFRDAAGGVLAGRGGAALAGINRFQPVTAPVGEDAVIRQVRLAEQNAAWLVGDAGLVLQSTSGGATWSRPGGSFPGDDARSFDFQALAVWGPHVWLAGSPGAFVFHSPDGGATWERFATDQTLPLRALCFLDEYHGWAVGELGTILATRDGGRTWLSQRGAAEARAAVLGVFADPRNTPWELFARLAGNEGYLSAAVYLGGEESLRGLAEISLEQRAREAMLAVGGCAAQRAASGLVAEWEERIVRGIRQWRPDVLVIEPAAAKPASNPLATAAGQAALNAAARAADAAEFPEHARLGLAPWSVKKVYAVQPPGEAGSTALVTASLAPRLGQVLADAARPARALFDQEYLETPAKIELQLLVDRTTGAGGPHADILAGVALASPSEARRRLPSLSPGNLDLVTRSAQKQRNVEQILLRARQAASETLVGQAEELTRDLPDSAAGDILFQLAERLRQQGRPDLAVEVYQRLLHRHPQQPTAETALWRLVQCQASSEAAWQQPKRLAVRRGVAEGVQPAAFVAPTEDEASAAGQSVRSAPLQVRDSQVTTYELDLRERDHETLLLAHNMARTFPALLAAPELRFSLAAAARRRGDWRESERNFRPLAAGSAGDPWRACAEGEAWLMKPAGEVPKQSARCPLVRVKPFLDGKLDDATWKDLAPLELLSPQDGIESSRAWLVRDEDYLYFAVCCTKAPGLEYPRSAQPRTHDAPLEDRDRVDLLIDLDRDYATWYRLTVDHRGWTGEACLEAAAWNPQWFVAAADEETAWTVEAAIPLEQFTARAPKSREVWAIGVQRVAPGFGFQSWSAPAAAEVRPEGFGYLIFE